MALPTYLHHISIHFPIVMLLGLGAIGLYAIKRETPELITILRWGGWAAMILTSLAAISGILSAPGWLGGDGPKGLSDHRDLAVTTWVITLIAAPSFDYGVRHSERDWRLFAIGAWCVAAFGAIGAGHWGGSQQHPEVVPWERSAQESP